jgi:carboxymethylenebutenolidase
MTTMTIKPYVHLVPVLTGGISYKNAYNFYKNHFIGKMSKDTKIIRISCTANKYQVVDDLILCFTHDPKLILCCLKFLLQRNI